MQVSPSGAKSALLGLTVTLWTIWQLVLTLNKCLPNTVERIYFRWYALLMDLWNESHCIAAFLRQVLYLINAVHKLYNYTSICHCQIYTLLHTVRLRWFHFIALQMDFGKCISLKFLCSTDRQSTWKAWGSLCKCSTHNMPWNKNHGIDKHWMFTLFQYSHCFKV